ncbi:peptide ligase PGM1-related protein (plasmid) [Streptomyces decoyicus]|uniref:preATP grasp domain-containing protein n=1 Tax=Streptomyces decoyicus TaxID=249567 RepID=UPI002E32E99E|nr:peptide ligase PGM1-related protein [Streptomyces decoyicus]
MTRLLIANDFIEDQAGVVDARRKKNGWWAQRMVWFAREGDILVMTVAPEDAYLDYVTTLTRTPRDSLRVVVPPPGRLETSVLTEDRLADPEFHRSVREALDGRQIDEILPLHPDTTVVGLARALGAESAVPGHGFMGQGGGTLVNSKAAFRAIAGGLGVPVPAGAVCANRREAEDAITELLEQGHPVILKNDLRAGGRGNEVVSPVEGVAPVGAERTVLLTDRAAVREYLARRWNWLTTRDRTPFVVERYYPGSQAVFAEFLLTEQGPEFAGQGEMVSAPMAKAEIIPAPGVAPATLTELAEGGRRLCQALHGLGYRGMVSADAIITPDGELHFSEYNGRITGSTHIYQVLGEHIVGEDYARTRVLYEVDGWVVPSFRAAADRLAEAGLAYSPATRTGAVLVMAYNPSDSTVRYTVVAETLDQARKQADQVESLFTDAPSV